MKRSRLQVIAPDRDSAYKLYRFRLHRNDLTAEAAENTERETREMNNSDATGFDINNFPSKNLQPWDWRLPVRILWFDIII